MPVRFEPAHPAGNNSIKDQHAPRVHDDGATFTFLRGGGTRSEPTGPKGKGPSARSYRRALRRTMAED